MKKFNSLKLTSAIILVSIVLYGIVGVTQSPQSKIQLTSDPPLNQIVPFEAEADHDQIPIQLTLQALDSTGQPLKNANLQVKLLTPPKTPWFTTDFPIVEGTTLLDVTASAPTGQLTLQQLFPIRGQYQVQVQATPQTANAFASFQQTLFIPVGENWAKYKNLAILAGILLATGFVGGWVIGGRQPIQPGEIAPHSVRLLLSGMTVLAIAALLYVNISAELSEHEMAGMHMGHDMASASHEHKPTQLKSQGLDVQLAGDMNATVGQLAQQQVVVLDARTQQPVTEVSVKVTATQLEHNFQTFTYESTPNRQGKLAWQQQFFDGAPHRIDAEIKPIPGSTRQFKPIQVAKTVEVEGVAPPLLTRLTSLIYFTAVLVLGLLAGLWFRRSSRPIRWSVSRQ